MRLATRLSSAFVVQFVGGQCKGSPTKLRRISIWVGLVGESRYKILLKKTFISVG
jgi:hypothetical protein